MPRDQFTFYRSYYEAIKKIPKKERDAVLMAIFTYALDGELPAISGIAEAVFMLVKPTLDSGRKKAENGKRSRSKSEANGKQNGTKPDANGERGQSLNEKEVEVEVEGEIEREVEVENECYIPPLPPTPKIEASDYFAGPLLDAVKAWLAYKSEKRQPYKQQGMKALFGEIRNNAQKFGDNAVAEIIRTSMASNYQGIVFDRLKGPGQHQTGNVFTELLKGGAFDE